MSKIITYIRDIPIASQFAEELPYNPKIKVLLKNKQKTGILSEMLFWIRVRAKAFHKIDFDRQVIIGDHIIDFYAAKLGLAIEIDRPGNDLKLSDDKIRQDFLESLGIRVFKKTAVEVKQDLSAVMSDLEEFIILHYTAAPDPETV